MAKRFIGINRSTGKEECSITTDDGPPPSNDVHVFIDVERLPWWTTIDHVVSLAPVDVKDPEGLWTGTRVAGSKPLNRRLSHADVLSLLTPTEWGDMNRFHPDAVGTTGSGAALNDVDVFWAVSVFNKAAYVDLDDPRFQQVMGMLTAKGIVAPQRAAQLATQLAALAASKG